jgi:chaperone required for assembly of F1-ATPase
MSDAAPNPLRAAQHPARRGLPGRFYETVGFAPADGGFVLTLDSRPARTPGKHPLVVPTEALAGELAAEWAAQAERIDPATMPLTRIVNVARDRVAGEMAEVRADIVRYAGSDLICYRASGPDSLVDRQNEIWSPLIDWARNDLGVRLILVEGIVHVPQEPGAMIEIDRAVAPLDTLHLAALHTATTLTGSAIIALALQRGRLSAEEAWAAAHVDEDWQMEHWGRDEVAQALRAARWREMKAAALLLGPEAG